MTTFSEMKIIMNQNGWESINPQVYQEEKRKKNVTARIGSMFFRLKKEIGKQWTYDVINKLRNEMDKFDKMLLKFPEKITK
jgi:hypothetical protein